MKPTIRSVAQRAGVSPMTVSRVLNGQEDKVAPETRQRIMDAVRALEYVPLSQPRTHHHRARSHVIGLVFDQLDEVRDYVGVQLYLGLRAAARQHGFDLLTILRDAPHWAREREEVRFLDGRCDGIIFINPLQRRNLLEKLLHRDIPLVCCYGNDVPPEIPRISLDETHAMQLIANHLHELGHEKIGFIAGPQSADERTKALQKAMRKSQLSLPAKVLFTGTQRDSWRLDLPAINEIITAAARMKLSALVCANDIIAAAAWRRLQQRNLATQIAVTGIDNLPLAERRGITTVHHPFKKVGFAAIEQLIAGQQSKSTFTEIQGELIIRESTS